MTTFAVVVVYDISDNKLRKRIEKTCKQYGMSHIQRSSFIGIMTENLRKELYVELLNQIEKTNAPGEISIRIYRIRLSDYKTTLRIGHLEGFDSDPSPGVINLV